MKRGGLFAVLLLTACGGTDSGSSLFGVQGEFPDAGSSADSGAASGGASDGGAQSGTGGATAAGCARDVDCKGDRLCVDGRCVDPVDGGFPVGSGGRSVSAGGNSARGGAPVSGGRSGTGGFASGGAASGTGGTLGSGGGNSCPDIIACQGRADCAIGLHESCSRCNYVSFTCGPLVGYHTSDNGNFVCSGGDCAVAYAQVTAHCCTGSGGAVGSGGAPSGSGGAHPAGGAGGAAPASCFKQASCPSGIACYPAESSVWYCI